MTENGVIFMRRCFDLANLGTGFVSPNPLVGSVIVTENQIIGEGFHQKFGEAHAEVNAIRNVRKNNLILLTKSCLFVSLEPCFHYGKTPPCVDLILAHKIPEVVISCVDPNPNVAGQSVQKLRDNGVKVSTGLLESEGRELIRPFITYITRKRPYVILKWAQSADRFMGQAGKQVWLSNLYASRMSHRWRHEVDAILIGTETARTDNPRLNTRLYPGNSPLRIVFDRLLQLSPTLHVMDDSQPTWIITEKKPPIHTYQQTRFVQLDFDHSFLPALMEKLYEANIGILLVEGGAKVHDGFLKANLWDEIRVNQTPHYLHQGIPAPIPPGKPVQVLEADGDQILYYFFGEN